jgi:hypothetical protein
MDVGGGERLPAVAPGGGKSGGADSIAELEACEDLAEDVQGQGDQRVGRHRFRGLRSSGLVAGAGRRDARRCGIEENVDEKLKVDPTVKGDDGLRVQ